MTWAEFQKKMADAGVRGEDIIGYIEIDPVEDGELFIERRPIGQGSELYHVNVIDKFD